MMLLLLLLLQFSPLQFSPCAAHTKSCTPAPLPPDCGLPSHIPPSLSGAHCRFSTNLSNAPSNAPPHRAGLRAVTPSHSHRELGRRRSPSRMRLLHRVGVPLGVLLLAVCWSCAHTAVQQQQSPPPPPAGTSSSSSSGRSTTQGSQQQTQPQERSTCLAPLAPPTQAASLPFCAVPADVSRAAARVLATKAAGAYFNPRDAKAMAALRATYLNATSLAQATLLNMSAAAQTSFRGVPGLLLEPAGCKGKAAAAAGKVVLYLHGGAYVMGSCAAQASAVAAAVQPHCLRVACIDYRLAPEHPFPAALDDAEAAYRALLKTHKPSDIGLIGDSAGGGLALALLLRLTPAKLPAPGAVVLWAPWAELSKAGDTKTTLAGVDPTLTYEKQLRDTGLAYAGDAANIANPLVSPLRGNFSVAAAGKLPPTLIQVGLRDVLLSDSVSMYRKLRAEGQPAEMSPWEAMWHVFQSMPGVPEAEAARAETGAWLAKHLGVK